MHHSTNAAALAAACAKCDSFAELTAVALSEMRKFYNGADVVCGPISTGGRGSIDENFRVFCGVIAGLQKQGKQLFSQIPYEERISFFRTRWRSEDPSRLHAYYMPILTEFYHPLIKTGAIRAGWFIPGWESSLGARWEHKELGLAGAERHYLTEEEVNELLETVEVL